MQISQQIESQGNWLFRWRSYLPFLFLPILITAIVSYQRPFQNDGLHHGWSLFCLGVSLLGLAVRCLTAGCVPQGTSGRNTRLQVAEQLNTLGIYSVVRHPLYLGNYLIGLGIILTPFHGWLALIYSLTFWLYYERIIAAEEAFLEPKFQEDFSSWANKTPAFLPKLSLWKPAVLPLSMRTILRREYTGLLVVVAFHTAMQAIKHHLITGELLMEPFWIIASLLAAITYLTLRTLKRHTQLLLVQGR